MKPDIRMLHFLHSFSQTRRGYGLLQYYDFKVKFKPGLEEYYKKNETCTILQLLKFHQLHFTQSLRSAQTEAVQASHKSQCRCNAAYSNVGVREAFFEPPDSIWLSVHRRCVIWSSNSVSEDAS